MAISTRNNKTLGIGEESCFVTTFVKGFFALEDQCINHCRDAFVDAGFHIGEEGYAIYDKELGGEHYCEHREKFVNSNGEKATYYPRLINYITKSGPVYVMILLMSLEKAKEIAPQFGIEVDDKISFEDNMQLVYDIARVITKRCRAEVMAGHEEGNSITKIQFADPVEDKMTMNVLHCSDCVKAGDHEMRVARKAMHNFNRAEEKNPNIIEDTRKELMPYEFGDDLNV